MPLNDHPARSAADSTDRTASAVPDGDTVPAADDSPARRSTRQPRNGARDRLRTQNAIITSVGRVISRDGFGGLRINNVAREAGVDKVLIYRYFGGLDELIGAYAKELDFWPSADEVAAYRDDEDVLAIDLPDRIAFLIGNLLRAIYRRPVTRDIIAWRLAEENELTRHLDQHRIDVTHEVIERFITRDELRRHPNLIPVIRVVANGALYLVVGERNNAVVAEPQLTGSLEEPDGWALLDQTVRSLLRGALC